MPEIEDQLRRYGQALDRAAAVAPAGAESRSDRSGRRRWSAVAIATAAAVLLAVVIGVGVAGRDDGESDEVRTLVPPTPSGPVTEAELEGRTYLVVAFERGEEVVPFAATHPRLMFESERVTVDDRCNGYLGTWQLSEGELVVVPGAQTLRGCAGVVAAQAHALAELLQDLSTEPDGARRHPTIEWIGDGVVELVLRDRRAVLVDVTDQEVASDGLPGPVGIEPPLLQELQPVDPDEVLDAGVRAWSTSPYAPADPVAARVDVERLLERGVWLASDLRNVQRHTQVVTPSAGFGPAPVVTVVTDPDEAGRRDTAAYVLSTDGRRIDRLAPTPLGGAGRPVRPGDEIAVPAVPVEGDAAAYVNGVRVPAEVDPDAQTTTVVVPSWARGEVVVTISWATPEAPVAAAGWYPVQPERA